MGRIKKKKNTLKNKGTLQSSCSEKADHREVQAARGWSLDDVRLTCVWPLAGVGGTLPPPPPQPDILAGSWDSSSDVGDGVSFQGFLGSPAAAGQSQPHQNPPAQDRIACG